MAIDEQNNGESEHQPLPSQATPQDALIHTTSAEVDAILQQRYPQGKLLWNIPRIQHEQLEQGDAAGIERFIAEQREWLEQKYSPSTGAVLPRLSAEDIRRFEEDADIMRQAILVVQDLHQHTLTPLFIINEYTGPDHAYTIAVNNDYAKRRLDEALRQRNLPNARILSTSHSFLFEHLVASGLCDGVAYNAGFEDVQTAARIHAAARMATEHGKENMLVGYVDHPREFEPFLDGLEQSKHPQE